MAGNLCSAPPTEPPMPQREFKVFSAADLMGQPIPPRRKRGDVPVRYVEHQTKVRGEALSEIWWSGRQWAVTAYGIERLDGTYVIDKGRLFENIDDYGWPMHMGEKVWVDNDDFVTSWLVAMALHGKRGEQARKAIARAHPQRDAEKVE
jgi:hypothetical protein